VYGKGREDNPPSFQHRHQGVNSVAVTCHALT